MSLWLNLSLSTEVDASLRSLGGLVTFDLTMNFNGVCLSTDSSTWVWVCKSFKASQDFFFCKGTSLLALVLKLYWDFSSNFKLAKRFSISSICFFEWKSWNLIALIAFFMNACGSWMFSWFIWILLSALFSLKSKQIVLFRPQMKQDLSRLSPLSKFHQTQLEKQSRFQAYLNLDSIYCSRSIHSPLCSSPSLLYIPITQLDVLKFKCKYTYDHIDYTYNP